VVADEAILGEQQRGAHDRHAWVSTTTARERRPDRPASLAAVPVPVGGSLSLEDVVAVAYGATVAFGDDARARVARARRVVEGVVERGDTVYGVTTGFGALADVRIDPAAAARLQHAIVRSHATAVGPPLSRAEARAMLLLRAHVLALGYSGVRPEVVDLMVAMLNADVIPAVPEQGSLGASGDLAPLANLALPLIGAGAVLATGGGTEPSAAALDRTGLTPVTLEAKEGLALVNGTQGMLSIGILAAVRLTSLLRTADVVAAMTIEGALGTDAPFDERLHRLRPHPGQLASAANLRRLLVGSPILASHRDSPHLVQDAYSLRCVPQVHGAARDALGYARGVLQIEAASVSDNPIVLADDEVRSGGNFHGQPVATAMDAMALATVPLASISERRLYRLLDAKLSNGLPAFLVAESGLNSGLMLAQYTAASLVSESKSLAHPASVDSIPSSAGQEDHVSMGMTSARHAREVVANAERVVALEAIAAAQALDLRAPTAPAAATAAAQRRVRRDVAFLDTDRELGPDIEAATALVRDGWLTVEAERIAGALA
jgi:histidine ammonia-lyase